MIYSGIADIVIDRDSGHHQIIELGDISLSGFTGYWNLTGQDMVQDIVFPHIANLHAGEKIVRAEPGIGMEHTIRTHFPDIMCHQEKGGLVLPYRRAHHTPDFMFYNVLCPRIEIVNADPVFMFASNNKAMLAETGYRGGDDFMPAQLNLARTYSPDTLDTLMDFTKGHDQWVFKLPETSRGQGNVFVRREDIARTYKALCLRSVDDNTLSESDKVMWHPNPCPVMTVQKYTPPAPFYCHGTTYHPTMRVAFTAHLPRNTQSGGEPGLPNWHVEIHDGYWKLNNPDQDQETGFPVSHSPNFVTDFNTQAKAISADIGEQVRADHFPGIARNLRTLAQRFNETDIAGLCRRQLDHGNSETRIGLAAMMLSHGRFYPDFRPFHHYEYEFSAPGGDGEPLRIPLGAIADFTGKPGQTPGELNARLLEILQDHPHSRPSRYLRDIGRRPLLYRERLPSQDFGREVIAPLLKPAAQGMTPASRPA